MSDSDGLDDVGDSGEADEREMLDDAGGESAALGEAELDGEVDTAAIRAEVEAIEAELASLRSELDRLGGDVDMDAYPTHEGEGQAHE